MLYCKQSLKRMTDHLNQFYRLVKAELNAPRKKQEKWRGLIFCAALLIFFIFASQFFVKASFLAKRETTNFKQAESNKTPLKNILLGSLSGQLLENNIFFGSQPSVNFLLLGIPGRGNDAPELTDSIILATLSPAEKKVTLISLPRDLWVRVPETNFYAKINSLYALGKKSKDENYGLQLMKQKVEEITGRKIDYFALIDLSFAGELVDRLGGLNVLVKEDIYDSSFPGPNHSYQTFELKAGWRYLDGETTLKYIRTRHSGRGDFDRIERQQQVLKAIKQKLMGFNPIFDLPKLITIFEDFRGHIKTDFAATDYFGLWQMAKNITSDQITKIIIDNSPENGLLVSEHILLDSGEAYVLKPKAGAEDYSEIQEFIELNQ